MQIHLDFTEQQAKVFKVVLEVTLQSLVMQEIAVKNALDEELKDVHMQVDKNDQMEAIANLQKYLADIAPQRVLIAEILYTVNKAEVSNIITPADFNEILAKKGNI